MAIPDRPEPGPCMMMNAMITRTRSLLSYLPLSMPLLAALLLLGACMAEDPPFSWGSGGGSSAQDDDDSMGNPDSTWGVAHIEVTRSDVQGTTGAVIRAIASWFPYQPVHPRPNVPNDADTCHGGSAPSGEYVVPDSTWDIGNMSLLMANGEYALDFDNDHFEDILPYTSWVPNAEFDILTTGGPDLNPSVFIGAIGTPASLSISSVEETGGGVTVNWLGGTPTNQLTILVTASGNDSLYWVACRVQDDGSFTLTNNDLAPLPAGTALLDVRRERTGEIEIGEYRGFVVGVSSGSAGITVVEAGDDDDSAL